MSSTITENELFELVQVCKDLQEITQQQQAQNLAILEQIKSENERARLERQNDLENIQELQENLPNIADELFQKRLSNSLYSINSSLEDYAKNQTKRLSSSIDVVTKKLENKVNLVCGNAETLNSNQHKYHKQFEENRKQIKNSYLRV